jgi:hypothetical protein
MKIEPRAATLRETALDRLIREARRQPFRWGEHDCCTFAAACVKARTGRDALAGLPRWSSEEDAAALLAERGGLCAAVTQCLGAPLAAPLLAAPGDVVLAVDPQGRELLAVCAGSVLVAPGPRGLVAMGLAAGRCAWRVR